MYGTVPCLVPLSCSITDHTIKSFPSLYFIAMVVVCLRRLLYLPEQSPL